MQSEIPRYPWYLILYSRALWNVITCHYALRVVKGPPWQQNSATPWATSEAPAKALVGTLDNTYPDDTLAQKLATAPWTALDDTCNPDDAVAQKLGTTEKPITVAILAQEKLKPFSGVRFEVTGFFLQRCRETRILLLQKRWMLHYRCLGTWTRPPSVDVKSWRRRDDNWRRRRDFRLVIRPC